MVSINVDFEVFKRLTSLRRSEDMTENEVIRELLRLPRVSVRVRPMSKPIPAENLDWACKGTLFPHGTEFRATYKGQQYLATVRNGALELRGKRYTSPSAAAISVTGNPVNGWRFWECLLPGATKWKAIAGFRK